MWLLRLVVPARGRGGLSLLTLFVVMFVGVGSLLFRPGVPFDPTLPGNASRTSQLEAAARKARALAPKHDIDPEYLAVIGTVESREGNVLVVRQLEYDVEHATDVPDLNEPKLVRVRPTPDVQVLTGTLGGMGAGTPVFAGGAMRGTIFHARVLSDLSAGQAVEHGAPLQMPEPTITHHEDDGAPPVAAGGGPALMAARCLQIADYHAPPGALEFEGCFGGPSFTYSVDPDVMLIDVANVVQLFFHNFNVTFALAGWQYNFPFQFVAEVGDDMSVGRPATMKLNVHPLSPDPAFSFVGGLGFNVGLEFRVHTVAGCGDSKLEPCNYIQPVDIAKYSSIAQTRTAPPKVGERIFVPAVECPAVPLMPIPGLNKLTIDLQICIPFEFGGAPFKAKVSVEKGAEVVGGPKVVEFDGNQPQFVDVKPTLRNFNLMFSEFEYTPQLYSDLQFKISTPVLKLYQSPPFSFFDQKFRAITTPFPPSGVFDGEQPTEIRLNQRAAPSVLEVLPDVGPVHGGNGVTVKGAGFTGASAVAFVDMNGESWPVTEFTVDSDDTITLVAPTRKPGTPGFAYVRVVASCYPPPNDVGCDVGSPKVNESVYTYREAVTTTTLETSPVSPTMFDESVSLKATVLSEVPGASHFGGDVAFYDGDTLLQKQPLQPISSGGAVAQTPPLPMQDAQREALGNHTLRAVYSGTPTWDKFRYQESTSPDVVHEVKPKPSTLSTPKASKNPAGLDDTVWLSTTASGPGMVEFYKGGELLDRVQVTGEGTEARYAFLGVRHGAGTHDITAKFAAADGYLDSAAPGVLKLTVKPSITSLTVSVSPAVSSTYVDGQRIFADLQGAPNDAKIDIYSNGEWIGFTQPFHGQIVTRLPVGNHTIKAVYAGDADHSASEASIEHTVGASPTSLTLTTYKREIDGRGDFVLRANGSNVPVGPFIEFFEGTTKIGQVMSAGSATDLPVFDRPDGIHTFTARFNGTAERAGSEGSLDVYVGPQPTAITSLTESVNPVWVHQPVTLKATLDGVPNGGTIEFRDGETVIASAPAQMGQDSCRCAQGTFNADLKGMRQIAAVYPGNDDYITSASEVLELRVNPFPPQVELETSPTDSVTVDKTIRLKAKVTAPPPGGGITPPPISSGTVRFLAMPGQRVLGSVPLQSDGTAEMDVTALEVGVGTHELFAHFLHTPSYQGGVASSMMDVKKIVQTPVLTVEPVSRWRETPTMHVDVGEIPLPKKVAFFAGPTLIGMVDATTGTVTFKTPPLSIGAHQLGAHIQENKFFSVGFSKQVEHVVTKAPTSVTLLEQPTGTFVHGDLVTVTARLAYPVGFGPRPGELFDGSALVGRADWKVVDGAYEAVFELRAAVGSHKLTVSYPGDGFYEPSMSEAATVTVGSRPTTATLTGPSKVEHGLPATFAVRVDGGELGTVQLRRGAEVLAESAMDLGAAPFVVPSEQLGLGNHTLTARYSGSHGVLPSTTEVSLQVTRVATTTTIESSSSATTYGEPVKFTARVASAVPVGGGVVFRDGDAVLGSVPLKDGASEFVTNALGGGSHAVTAVYNATALSLQSTSTPVTVVVAPKQTATMLSTSGDATYGEVVALEATVDAPSGVVTFVQGRSAVGSASLQDGTARLELPALGAGVHTFEARFGGTADHAASSSAPATVAVAKAPSSVTLAAGGPADAGAPVTFTAHVAPEGTDGAVRFLRAETLIGVAEVVEGVARFTTSSLPPGTHTIVADYTGDLNFHPARTQGVQVIQALIAVHDTVAEESQAADTTASFVVSLTPAPGRVSVSYATQDGSAVAGKDYLETAGTLTFEAGESEKVIVVPVRAQQTKGTKTFTLRLSDAQGEAVRIGRAVATGTIRVTHETCTIIGTPGNDVLTGRGGPQVICGMGGNDILIGTAGNDVLYGGDGDDQLFGNEGDDRLVGGPGADWLAGHAGDDHLEGSDGVEGNDQLDGGPGSDTCSADAGDSLVRC